MLEQLGAISLAIFESIFSNKISNIIDSKEMIKLFNTLDNDIIEEINTRISEEYEKEKISDYIGKYPQVLNRKYNFISDSEKENFIDSFYKNNPDLKYVGSKRINICLETYINNLNEILNKTLSSDTLYVSQKIDQKSDNIISISNDNTEKIIQEIRSFSGHRDEAFNKNYMIPNTNKLFTGRINEIDQIQQGLKDNTYVFLSGLGGMGKTQIARKIVEIIEKEFQLILWINASDVNMLINEVRKIAVFYSLINENEFQEDIISTKVNSFIQKHRNCLIIIDGADDFRLEELIHRFNCTNIKILITTQNSNIDKDQFCVITIDKISLEEGKEFLLRNTNSRIFTDTDEEDTQSLITEMDSMPLALEYARSYINKRGISFSDYKKIYDQNKIHVLKSNLVTYKKTAYIAWKMSYEKIINQNSHAYEVLAMCSFMNGNQIPIYEIFVQTGKYNDYQFGEIIDAIKNYSFFLDDCVGVSMHGLTQELIRIELEQENEYDKHMEMTIEILSNILPQKISDINDRILVEKLIQHTINIIKYSPAEIDFNTTRFIGSIGTKLYALGRYKATIEFLEEAIKKINKQGLFSVLEYSIFLVQSYHYIGQDTAAMQIADNNLGLITAYRDLSEEQKNYLWIGIKSAKGIIFKDHGEYEKAIEMYEQAYECLKQFDDTEQKINLKNNLGVIYKNIYNFPMAMDCFEEALNLAKDDKRHISKILGNIGDVYKFQDIYDKAINNYTESLKYAIDLGDKRTECVTQEHIGNCLLCMNSYDEAIIYLDKAMEIAKSINHTIGIVTVMYDYGAINRKKGNKEEAYRIWSEAYELSCSCQYEKGKKLIKYAMENM